MHVAERLDDLRAKLADWRSAGERIALVPTMGNLHAGHLALVAEAARQADRSVVSIFVNPAQFGPGEDFETYPRTPDDDLRQLEVAACDLAWMPAVDTMYPLPESFPVGVPGNLSGTLCGRDRPGHFDGVAGVVLRLFNQVDPDVAVFGEKDFQQLLVIRQMARDLSLLVAVAGLPTVREADGLAMSSRNRYLSAGQRSRAPVLYRTLIHCARELAGGGDWAGLREEGWRQLAEAGFEPHYLEWRSAENLGRPQPGRPQRLLAAARLGEARLIDNVPVAHG